jgi:CheY-like chemotaxis protein
MVSLRFPTIATKDLVAEPPVSNQPCVGMATLAVLLVDDDELMQASTRMLLEALGHDVTSASSGEEALSLLDQGLRPEAVILDMNMPGLGGKGTLPRLRDMCPTVPVFLATGRADDEAIDLVVAHPFVTLLPKPFGFEELQGEWPGISWTVS